MSLRIDYTPRGSKAFAVDLLSEEDPLVTLLGDSEGSEPEISGEKAYRRNQTLVDNLWAYGVQENASRRTRNEKNKTAHRKAVREHSRMTLSVAGLIATGVEDAKGGKQWCSSCFQQTKHMKVKDSLLVPLAYLCKGCGSPTSVCLAPQCSNMAVRRPGPARLPRYCAEHRHDIPSFAKLTTRFEYLDDVNSWLNYEKKNFAAGTRVASVSTAGALAAAPVAFVAAPAVGALIGASALGGNLAGAAAVSHGLAMLGFGSLASGGLGMAGGTAVVVASGSALGARLGGVTASAYASDDKSFAIHRIRTGQGNPVVFASGFLSEGRDSWDDWQSIIDERFPDNPVYRLDWGAKELKNLYMSVANAGVKGHSAFRFMGSATARSFLPFLAADLSSQSVRNPWSVAKARADKTGAALADVLARTDGGPFILVGHSLGARVMATAASALGVDPSKQRVEAVHLLGAAIGAEGDWRPLNDSVSATAWNYYSSNDLVLSKLYRIAQLGQKAAGNVGIKSRLPAIKNVNVSKNVKDHGGYFSELQLR